MSTLAPVFLLASTAGLVLACSGLRAALNSDSAYRRLLISLGGSAVSALCAAYFSASAAMADVSWLAAAGAVFIIVLAAVRRAR